MNKQHKNFIEHCSAKVICLLLKIYKKFLSPFQYVFKVCFGLSCECRFYPTCSEYAHQCFQRYSFFKALYFTLKRLCRCHPLCSGGYDPVP